MNKLLLAVMLLGIPMSALADHEASGYQGRGHQHFRGCEHDRPRGEPSRQGSYELRPIQKWVPGRFEQVWVPQQCMGHRHHRHRQHCRGGYYEQQWRPGHYETVQEWVWVPSRHFHEHPATGYPGRPASGWRVGAAAVDKNVTFAFGVSAGR